MTGGKAMMVDAMQDEGWDIVTDEGFVGLIGPFWSKDIATAPRFRFPTDQRHHNLRGVLQGGALMTFADRAMGITARAYSGAPRSATIQFSVQFLDAVQIGEVVEIAPTVLRVTRQMVFMSAMLTVGDRDVAMASGVWKKLMPREG